ncbi:DUF1631 domain-containing protein [Parachitinimonas caeni]|uniref:DUF1631 domain-containing protein n=1 Tax=Parachitinimonas caeni TaxID=3031301 RepID=A0ABT7DZN6_9NEIS|nr:DUF1631 domain-containing protein [Parachitinimonas caeni]MDK2125523.1 DUF1631 domain-containing protein [Parachitinimonas caeni]
MSRNANMREGATDSRESREPLATHVDMKVEAHLHVVPNRPPETVNKAMNRIDSLAMLSSCRDMAADLLCRSLSSMLDKIEESLLELAEQSLDREAYNLYMQARGDAQSKRGVIEVEFRRQFVSAFDRAVGGGGDKATFGNLDVDSLQLSLVAHDDYEEDLAVTNMANRLKNRCSDELNALNQRIGTLMKLSDDDQGSNPMSPQSICDAFRAACQQLESDLNVRLIVLKQFEQVAAENVPNVYSNLNKFLIQRNILPVLPKMQRKKRPVGGGMPSRQGRPGEMVEEYVGNYIPGGAAGQSVPSYAVGNEQELLSTLQQLLAFNQVLPSQMMQLTQGVGPSLLGQGSPAQAPSAPALSMPQLGTMAGQSFLDALNDLQQGRIDPVRGDTLFDTEALLSGAGNVLHQIKDTSFASSLGHVDVMTIDIVAMLFDYIFDDKSIPGAMKAMIGRLQIPVLKVAMLDTKFFARKNHPTRRLLDRLSEAALGWREADGLEDRLYKKIESIVEFIIREFDENIAVFEQAHADLDVFLSEEDKLADLEAEKAAKVLEAQEQIELAKAHAAAEIDRRMVTCAMPDLIRKFVSDCWRPALEFAFRNGGKEGNDWQTYVQAMDDLIWSVAPKAGVEDRLRLVNMLPKLLKLLERGTEEAGVAREERERFFSELVHSHALAIKSGMRPAAAAPMPNGAVPGAPVSVATAPAVPAVAPGAAAPASVPSTTASTDSSSHLADLPAFSLDNLGAFEGAGGQWEGGMDKYSDYNDVVANQLKRGTWVEFSDGDGELHRMKLAWVSPMKSRFLFTNRQGQNGQEYTLAELVGKFRSDEVRIIESAASVERAVSDMIDMLQPVAG